MKKITFEDATLTSQAKVTIDGVDHLVTEAEYSGGTDLNANTFNQLQDNVENAIEESKLEEYSTSEQRIGTFLGKPLYRRVFEVPETSISSSGTTVINFNLDGNVDVKKMNAFIKTQTSNYGFNLAHNGVYDGFRMRLFGNTIQLLVGTDVAAEKKITSGNVIVEYTKTTD